MAMSWQLRAARVTSRFGPKLALRLVPWARAQRVLFAINAVLLHERVPGLQEERCRIGGVPCDWITVDGQGTGGVLLYLHGGGFMVGTVAGYRHLIGRLSAASGLRGLGVEYRLSPEDPFPAAFDDALAVWRGLLAAGHDPARIVIAGDSAGGTLALTLMGAIAASDMPMPGAVVAVSPLTDLTLQNPSLTANAPSEVLIDPVWGGRAVAAYLAGADPRDPRASPVFAAFARTCPVLIEVAGEEMLLDDARIMADVLRAAGAPVTLNEWPGAIHAWPIMCGRLPEADAAVAEIGAFIRAALAA